MILLNFVHTHSGFQFFFVPDYWISSPTFYICNWVESEGLFINWCCLKLGLLFVSMGIVASFCRTWWFITCLCSLAMELSSCLDGSVVSVSNFSVSVTESGSSLSWSISMSVRLFWVLINEVKIVVPKSESSGQCFVYKCICFWDLVFGLGPGVGLVVCFKPGTIFMVRPELHELFHLAEKLFYGILKLVCNYLYLLMLKVTRTYIITTFYYLNLIKCVQR